MKIKISYQEEETTLAAAAARAIRAAVPGIRTKKSATAAPFFHLYMKTCKLGGTVVQYQVEKSHGVPPQG